MTRRGRRGHAATIRRVPPGEAHVMEIGDNRYGKQAIRLVKVVRGAARHEIRDLTVSVALEGDFAASYTDANNSLVIVPEPELVTEKSIPLPDVPMTRLP